MPDGFAVSQTMKDLGFKDGDIITDINGKPLDNMLDASRFMMVRDVHNITTRHQDGQVETIAIPEDIGKTLFKAGELQSFVPMGTSVLDSVIPGSPADKAGLAKGDEIVSVNGKPIQSFADLDRIKKEHPNEQFQVGYLSGGQRKDVAITPDADNHFGVFAKANIAPEHRNYDIGASIASGFGFTYWTLHDYVAQFK